LPKSRFLGSVTYFPEHYGADLIRVSIDILSHRPVPPAVFVEHKLITPDSVDHYYPNDAVTKLIRTEPFASSHPTNVRKS
jgi:ribose transport system substrate-binding protein